MTDVRKALFCTECGAALDDTANFCWSCGVSQDGMDEIPASTSEPAAHGRSAVNLSDSPQERISHEPSASREPRLGVAEERGTPAGKRFGLGLVALILIVVAAGAGSISAGLIDDPGWFRDPMAARIENLKASGCVSDGRVAGYDCRDVRFTQPLNGLDLAGSDFRGALLRGADMSGSDLRGANFEGVNLRETSFKGADLRDANFKGALMTQADLRGALTAGADFTDAILINIKE